MGFIRGVTRNEVILFPESVEDYITEDNPVRFIDAFATSLDLAELGTAESRTSIRYDQAVNEPGLLFDERLKESWRGDELDCPEL